MFKSLFLLTTLALSSFPAFAQPALKELFQKDFSVHYEAGSCGTNIMNLVDRAAKAGIDLSKANVVKLTNAGSSIFGLVAATYARNNGPGDRNWGFHVFLESEGEIYDFDFGNEPNVVPVAEYFEKMFFQLQQMPRYDFQRVSKERKLAEYEIKVMPALEFVKKGSEPNAK